MIKREILLPEGLAVHQPRIEVTVSDDAMKDADIIQGDILRVFIYMVPHDGDTVVVNINGRYTARALFTDEQDRQWLVPRNEQYDATPIDEAASISIVGTVVSIERRMPRAASADCIKAIRRTVARRQEPQRPTAEQVDAVIAAVAPEVGNGRQWYAVYRALADAGCTPEGCFREFAERVGRVVPGHAHLPVAKELGRLAVQSFRKRVALWDASDAPVSGQRFADYRHLAHLAAALLSRRG
ncbi:MAG: hypothetical protein II864_11615 [Prevotella sp.]|nr:hypothetical protein [Prevotella sp.]